MNSPPAAATGSLPPGYPADLQRTWQTADGAGVTLRALRPDDLDRELAFVAGLSEESLHLRLQYTAKGVTREDAARLLTLDYVDTLAVGAFIDGPGGEREIGVSRYARIAGTDRAECAIVVADDWHGRGLGTELMRSLGAAARRHGIRWLEGSTLGENQRIQDWARRFGFDVRTEPDSGGLVKVTLDLATVPF